MRSKALVYVIAVLAAIFTLCICSGSAALAGYFIFSDQIQAVIDNPNIMLGPANGSSPFGTDTQNAEPTSTPLVLSATQDVDVNQLFAPVWESRGLLDANFVEQPVSDEVLGQGALDGLSAYLEDQGVNPEDLQAQSSAPSAASLAAEAGTPSEAQDAFAPFWELWRNLQYGQIRIEGTYEDAMRASLRGMVDALGDPHTAYMDPEQLRQTDITLNGEYDGIGAFVDTTTEYVTIVSPMDGSPAQEAGLQPGDEVIAINGEDMTGIPGDAVISRIMGPEGSSVVLTIRREGLAEPFDVSIVRAHISVPSVVSEMRPDGVAYVQLTTFGATTESELRSALEDLIAQNPKGLILDLRNNGGGYLNTAVEVSSEFISRGVILYEEYGDGSRDSYDALNGGEATDIPMVVLVNNGTASASEILAGALQDYGRAQLVGETTYGKGSVQQPIVLSNGAGALRITIAHWLTPNERLIHGIGLTPDYEVALTQEDVAQELDPQLDKAVELLLSGASN